MIVMASKLAGTMTEHMAASVLPDILRKYLSVGLKSVMNFQINRGFESNLSALTTMSAMGGISVTSMGNASIVLARITVNVKDRLS